MGLGGWQDAELRHIGSTENNQPGTFEPRNKLAVVIRHKILHQFGAVGNSVTGKKSENIFQQKRHSGERPALKFIGSRFARIVVHARNDRIEVWVQMVDTFNRGLHQFDGLNVLVANQFRLGRRILKGQIAECSHNSFLLE